MAVVSVVEDGEVLPIGREGVGEAGPVECVGDGVGCEGGGALLSVGYEGFAGLG